MKVGVIMGGISSEREISLKSGNSIVEKIDKNKYEVIPVVIDDKEDIRAYIDTLEIGSGLNEEEIKKGYEDFKSKLSSTRLDEIATKHNIDKKDFSNFIELIMNRMIFDGEYLNDLLAPQELGWKARAKKELELMEDLIPLLKKLAGEQEISGLSAYE